MKKGVKLCSIASLVLSIMFLVLFANSSDANALRHEYLTIPAFQRTYVNYSYNSVDTLPGFELRWYDSNFAPDWLSFDSLNKQFVLNSVLNGSSCKYQNHTVSPNLDGYSISSAGRSYGVNSSVSSYYCRPYFAYGSSPSSFTYSIPFFDSSSLPSGINWSVPIGVLSGQLPYSYGYSTIKLSDTATNTDGEEWSHHLLMSDFFQGDGDHIVSKFEHLIIPFDEIKQDLTGPMVSGRPIEFKGELYFPDVSYGSGFDYAPSFLNSGTFRIVLNYFKPNSNSEILYLPCSLRTIVSGSGLSLLYSCKTDLSEDLSSYHIFPHLEIDASNSDHYVFDTSSDWGWSGAFLTTDNDDTPGAVISSDCVGNNCSEAIGSVTFPSSGNFFDDLSNLFNFNFLNPFAPLFALFSNISSCGHIPILAGMLGASDDTYCPWFPGSVRTILTPVMAFSSSMLLFGFLVRWLGSSSGNFVEDTGTHDFGSYSVRSRFKKGGKK